MLSAEWWIVIILALVLLGGPSLVKEFRRLIEETRKEPDVEDKGSPAAELRQIAAETRPEIQAIKAEAEQVVEEILIGPADPLRVFVCSMQEELKQERAAVREYLQHLGRELGLTRPILLEDMPASPDTPEDVYSREVERCEAFVMIVAEDISPAVLREHQLALEHKRPCFYFVKSVEQRTEAAQRFLGDIVAKWVEFQTPEELAKKVAMALVAYLLETRRQRRLAHADVLALLALGERLKIDRQVLDQTKEQITQESWPRQPWEPEMVYIPEGWFWMGTSPGRIAELKRQYHYNWFENERPQTRLFLKGYWIGKYPVTNAQYKRFVEATDRKRPSHWEGGAIPAGKDNHPVTHVTWDDAVAYCKWLAQVTGKPYRLPSEAEWEKAARGPNGLEYPWGNQWDASKCNMQDSGPGDTTPVGRYSPRGDSPYGCADMAGNVWEWTSSLYKPYRYQADDGCEDMSSRDSRVVRGGSFGYYEWRVRAPFRLCNYRLPDDEWFDLGFRCGA